MVDEKVFELIAVRVKSWLFAEAGWFEEREGLESSESSLALGNGGGGAGDQLEATDPGYDLKDLVTGGVLQTELSGQETAQAT